MAEVQWKQHEDCFREFISGIMKEWKIPGISVGVVKDGKVVFSEGLGCSDAEKGLQATPDTLFWIASCTKAFTTMSVGILADEGRLDWDTPVRKLIPGFQMYDPYATVNLTVRDLVTHRTGVPGFYDSMMHNPAYNRRDVIDRLKYLEPSKGFRSVYQYNNIMLMVAGHIVEIVEGCSWEEFVRKKIFEPLGMAGSRFSHMFHDGSPDLSKQYIRLKGKIVEIPFYGDKVKDIVNAGPAGGIKSSANELLKWLKLHLNKGMHEGRRIISEKNLKEMHTPQVIVTDPVKYDELSFMGYGLGWRIQNYRGLNTVFHKGSGGSVVLFAPSINSGIVILPNLSTPANMIIAYNLLDRLLGLEQISWNGRFIEEETLSAGKRKKAGENINADIENSPMSHDLKDYTGKFRNVIFGDFDIESKDGEIFAIFSGRPYKLKHYSFDIFKAEHPFDEADQRIEALNPFSGLFPRVVFSTDEKGRICRLSFVIGTTGKEIVFNRLA